MKILKSLVVLDRTMGFFVNIEDKKEFWGLIVFEASNTIMGSRVIVGWGADKLYTQKMSGTEG